MRQRTGKINTWFRKIVVLQHPALIRIECLAKFVGLRSPGTVPPTDPRGCHLAGHDPVNSHAAPNAETTRWYSIRPVASIARCR